MSALCAEIKLEVTPNGIPKVDFSYLSRILGNKTTEKRRRKCFE
jgi:hypothetical protein